MSRFHRSIARFAGGLALVAAACSISVAPTLAGGHEDRRDRSPVPRHRSQYESIREGLGPDLMPYTRQTHWGYVHRYPKYPHANHSPLPAGPRNGDVLYQTGPLPSRRG